MSDRLASKNDQIKITKRVKINVDQKKKEYTLLLEQLAQLKDSTDQMTDLIGRMIKIAKNKTLKVDFNMTDDSGENIITWSWKYPSLMMETCPLIRSTRFDRNRKDYLGIAIEHREKSLEKHNWLLIQEQLINAGCMVLPGYDLFGRYPLFWYENKRYSYRLRRVASAAADGHFATRNTDENNCCLSCSSPITDGEPYFIGPSNCECTIHYSCIIPLIVSMVTDISAVNPLERKIIKCPVCQVTITPSFIRCLYKMMFEQKIDILSPLIKHFPESKEIEMSNKELFIFKKYDLSYIHQKMYLIRYQYDHQRVNCKTDDCPGFFLMEEGDNKFLKCFCCKKRRRWRVTLNAKMTEDEKKSLRGLLIKNENIRPCPTCSRPIEKNGGCNSMRCDFCHKYFTWEVSLRSDAKIESAKYY